MATGASQEGLTEGHTVEEPSSAVLRELLVVRLTKARKDKENFIASLTKERDNVSSMLPINTQISN
jgi:hypothetical protein